MWNYLYVYKYVFMNKNEKRTNSYASVYVEFVKIYHFIYFIYSI